MIDHIYDLSYIHLQNNPKQTRALIAGLKPCFLGHDPFNQNFRKFRSKLNGSARSKRKSFEKSGSSFEVDHFVRLDRSDWNWPFHSTFSTHFQSQYLAVRYVSSVLLVHTYVVTTITKLCYAVYVLAVINGLFPERLSNILSLFESGVRRSLNRQKSAVCSK